MEKARLFGKGSSTLEILIAFAILTLALTAVILVFSSNQAVAVDTQVSNEALGLSQAQLETARAAARQDFASLISTGPTNATLGALTYSKKLDVKDLGDGFTKQATSTVSWTSGGQTYSVVLSTLLADFKTALTGDTCSPALSGDWTSPQLLGSADVGANNGGTDVDVLAKKAYVTADAASAAKHDFYVIDVSDPNVSNLPILGSIDTGPGLAAVRVAGRYAYVADISTVFQLQVIDISNQASPTLVSTASLKVTPTGDAAVGNSIFYANKRVYLGLDGPSAGKEFYVIDVTDPLHPAVKASYETNTKINAILVKDNTAYLATRYTSDGVTPAQLRVLDLSQVDTTGVINELTPFAPDPSTMSGESLDISKDGKTLYLGEGGANPGNKPEFFSLDVTSPGSISIQKSKYIPTSNNVTVDAIRVRSNLAFLWTNDTNLGFQIWDLNNLGGGSPYGAINTQQTATGGLDCEGNILYTAQRSQKALQILGPYVAQPFDYTISKDTDITVNQGSSGSNHVTLARTSGASVPVTISLAGLPAGATPTYANNPCTPGGSCSVTVTIATAGSTLPSTYPITVTGSPNGATSPSTTFNLVVNPAPFDYTLGVSPASQSLPRGSSYTEVITVTKTSGTGSPVTVGLTGFQNNVSVTSTVPNPPTCTPTPTCTISFTITAAANAQRVTRTITATGSSPTHTTTFSLTVP